MPGGADAAEDGSDALLFCPRSGAFWEGNAAPFPTAAGALEAAAASAAAAFLSSSGFLAVARPMVSKLGAGVALAAALGFFLGRGLFRFALLLGRLGLLGGRGAAGGRRVGVVGISRAFHGQLIHVQVLRENREQQGSTITTTASVGVHARARARGDNVRVQKRDKNEYNNKNQIRQQHSCPR